MTGLSIYKSVIASVYNVFLNIRKWVILNGMGLFGNESRDLLSGKIPVSAQEFAEAIEFKIDQKLYAGKVGFDDELTYNVRKNGKMWGLGICKSVFIIWGRPYYYHGKTHYRVDPQW